MANTTTSMTGRKNLNPEWHVVTMDRYVYGPFVSKKEAFYHVKKAHGDCRLRNHTKKCEDPGVYEYFPPKYRGQQKYQTYYLINDDRLLDNWYAAFEDYKRALMEGSLPWK